MQHGLGRGARNLIALCVLVGHGLLFLLPVPVRESAGEQQEMQVMFDPASPAPPLPQTAPAPAAEKKQRVAPPPVSSQTPRPQPVAIKHPAEPAVADIRQSAPVLTPVPDAPAISPSLATPNVTSSTPARPVSTQGSADDAIGSVRAVGGARAASAGVSVAQQRKAAWCDTQLRDSDYPVAARRDEQEGRVLIQTRVLSSGKTQDAKVVKSSGFALLDQAALRASTHWPCTPASLAGVAVDSWIAVPVVFRID